MVGTMRVSLDGRPEVKVKYKEEFTVEVKPGLCKYSLPLPPNLRTHDFKPSKHGSGQSEL